MNHAEMIAKWDEHISFEFSSRDVSSTIATMIEDAYVNHVPVMTGGYGHAALRRFFAEDFISLDAGRHHHQTHLPNTRAGSIG
jgi:carboxymethylenebutenolidase